MPWRVHLSNRALYRLDILNAPRSPLLAAWSQTDRIAYFDLETGAAMGERGLEIADSDVRRSDTWQAVLPQLIAPNRAYPPVVFSESWTIYTMQDGRRRFYEGNVLYIVNGQNDTKLKLETVVAVGLERTTGLLAALDHTGKLHLYDAGQATPRTFDVALPGPPNARSGVAVMIGGEAIVIASGHFLIKMDRQGNVMKRMELPYSIGQFASSPDGHLIACADIETNVLRIYDGDRFQPMFQRHAVDLMAGATQLQLIADLPPSRVAINSLAVDDAGNLAFALAGVICVTAAAQMRTLPRPQKLI